MNAYLLAKGLRALGVEADSFDQGGGYPLQVPHWQDAEFDPQAVDAAFWDWANLPTSNDYHRPPWAKILGNDGAAPWYDTQEDYQAHLARVLRGQRVFTPKAQQRADLATAISECRSPSADQAQLIEDAATLPDWRSIRAIARAYDLTVLCGPTASCAALLPRDLPYVTFEHATMRYVPSLADEGHRLLAAAYRHADANVITNADCWEAAGMLGIRDRSVFIPHPLDDVTFSPGECADRSNITDALNCELLFLAPARHSRSEAAGSKRNDRILYAYARYVREAEPAGAQRAGLLLAAWGTPEHIAESQALIAALGLTGRVGWLPCLPKRRLLHFYRAADVVLDQFSDTVGSFGTVTAEAMACGRPVITYYNPAAHTWCENVLPEHPPVLCARTTDEIYDALLSLTGNPAERDWRGRIGRRWVERYHSLARIAALHKTLYERVLATRLVPLFSELGRTQ